MNTKKLTTKQIILKILLYFVVIDICIFTLYPYFAMFCSALKSRAEIFYLLNRCGLTLLMSGKELHWRSMQ